jgi:hypothetical protein
VAMVRGVLTAPDEEVPARARAKKQAKEIV